MPDSKMPSTTLRGSILVLAVWVAGTTRATAQSQSCCYKLDDPEGVPQCVEGTAASGAWQILRPGMYSPRANHTATAMKNGRVLIAGGFSGHHTFGERGEDWTNPKTLDTAEIFDDKRTPKFIPLSSRLRVSRRGHSAVAVGNRVLVFGGVDDKGRNVKQVELYDDITERFEVLSLPAGLDLTSTAATRLPNGSLLLTGGAANPRALWLFDGRSFQNKGELPSPRAAEDLGFLVDDRIVLISKRDATVQCLDPKTFRRQECDDLPAQDHFSAALANRNGQTVLLVRGGLGNSPQTDTRMMAWRFSRNGLRGTWTPVAPASTYSRDEHIAVPLDAVGKILVVGGVQEATSCPWLRIPWVEDYSLKEQAWVSPPPSNMMCSHGGGAGVPIRGGRCALVTGGFDVSYSYVASPGCSVPESRGPTVDAVAVAEVYCALVDPKR